jgi:hypothetical protein
METGYLGAHSFFLPVKVGIVKNKSLLAAHRLINFGLAYSSLLVIQR